jgi:methionyl-tRNA synthetase
MESCAFFNYLEKVFALIGATNKYIDVTAPFKLAKDPSQKEKLGTILYTCAEAVRIALVYLSPFMPVTCQKGLEQLNWSAGEAKLDEVGHWGVLAAGTKVGQAQPLFPRKQ